MKTPSTSTSPSAQKRKRTQPEMIVPDDNLPLRRSYVRASRSPSYVKAPRMQPEMIMPHVLISSLNVPGRNVVIVRPTAVPRTNSEDHISPVPVGEDVAIPEEEAICKFCFKVLGEENVLKTNCRCNNALVHEQCTADWSRVKGNNNCDVCGQVVQNLPVILLWASTYGSVDRQVSNNKSLFSRLKRSFTTNFQGRRVQFRANSNGGGFGYQSNSRIFCQICGKDSHIAFDCKHRKDPNFLLESTLPASTSHSNSRAYVAASSPTPPVNCYIDSAATNHVTNDLTTCNSMNVIKDQIRLQ